jgi:hypothetical protein
MEAIQEQKPRSQQLGTERTALPIYIQGDVTGQDDAAHFRISHLTLHIGEL